MADVVQTEVTNTQPQQNTGRLAKVLEAFKRRFHPRKEIEQSLMIGEVKIPQIPTSSGYAELINDSRKEKGDLAGSLEKLYPNLVVLLDNDDGRKNKADGSFSIKITDKWGFNMDESTRQAFMQELQNGNKKVIAILAYYLSEKAKGNLSLEVSKVPSEASGRIRQDVQEQSIRLMQGMERMIAQEEHKPFQAEEQRGNLKEILSQQTPDFSFWRRALAEDSSDANIHSTTVSKVEP